MLNIQIYLKVDTYDNLFSKTIEYKNSLILLFRMMDLNTDLVIYGIEKDILPYLYPIAMDKS